MAVNGVNNTAAYSATQMAEASRTVSNELDKDAFLRLLIAELANQDPMNPMDDREFISQMAQFSSLEQMSNVAKGMESFANLQQYSAVSYVGMEIAYQAEDATGALVDTHGTVVGVLFDPKEGPMLEILGQEKLVPLKEISGVAFPIIENPEGSDGSDSQA